MAAQHQLRAIFFRYGQYQSACVSVIFLLTQVLDVELLWGVLGVIAWVGWSFTCDKRWQKPILYWFVLAQICLVTAVLMVKSSQASEQPTAFVNLMTSKTKDIFQTMPNSVLPRLRLQAQITECDDIKLAEAVNDSPAVIVDWG